MKLNLPAKVRDASGPMRATCVLLFTAFLTGGGARGDIQSLMVLRPLAVLLLGYGLLQLTGAQVRANLTALTIAAASLALLALHLVPLPPEWWPRLPGRELVAEIDRAAGLGPVWRPLSLTPEAAVNALFAAVVPCAALVLGIQLDTKERQRLLWLILLLGGASALLGMTQIFAEANGPLFPYKITNNGSAVGLFANRNHQAVFLAVLLPMLAVWAVRHEAGKAGAQFRILAACLAAAALLPLILITGSRAGVILAAVALLLVPFVLARKPFAELARFRGKLRHGSGGRLPLAGAALTLILAALVALTVMRGRGVAWERLFGGGGSEDLRFIIVPTELEMIAKHFPFGSGFGSFERIYQVYEPDLHLRPTYANHAHNDFLELALTGGVPALVLLAAAILAILARGRALFASGPESGADLRLARLGLSVVLLLGLASLADYPLRVPSLTCLFVASVVWMSCPLSKNPAFGLPS